MSDFTNKVGCECQHMLSLSVSKVSTPSVQCRTQCCLVQFDAAEIIFSVVAQAPFHANAALTLHGYTLQAIWLGLMALTSLLLLLPPSHFTHTWHMASEQFNSANDDSPVWEAYRVCGLPSAAYHIWDRSAYM